MTKLEEIRKAQGLLQRDVARRAGVSRSYYTLIENGQRSPSIRKAKSISTALEISLDVFFDVLGVSKRDIENGDDGQASASEFSAELAG